MRNIAIYFEMDGCGMCKAAKPKFVEQCKRLGLPLRVVKADKEDASEMGEERKLPYAIVVYEGKRVKGYAWDVIDIMKEI